VEPVKPDIAHLIHKLTTAITCQHATVNNRKHHPIVEVYLSLSGKLETLIPMMLSELRPTESGKQNGFASSYSAIFTKNYYVL